MYPSRNAHSRPPPTETAHGPGPDRHRRRCTRPRRADGWSAPPSADGASPGIARRQSPAKVTSRVSITAQPRSVDRREGRRPRSVGCEPRPGSSPRRRRGSRRPVPANPGSRRGAPRAGGPYCGTAQLPWCEVSAGDRRLCHPEHRGPDRYRSVQARAHLLQSLSVPRGLARMRTIEPVDEDATRSVTVLEEMSNLLGGHSDRNWADDATLAPGSQRCASSRTGLCRVRAPRSSGASATTSLGMSLVRAGAPEPHARRALHHLLQRPHVPRGSGRRSCACSEGSGHEVEFPAEQTCCGQMHFTLRLPGRMHPRSSSGSSARSADYDVVVTAVGLVRLDGSVATTRWLVSWLAEQGIDATHRRLRLHRGRPRTEQCRRA